MFLNEAAVSNMLEMEKPSLGALFYTYLEVRYSRVDKIRKNGHQDTETLGVYT